MNKAVITTIVTLSFCFNAFAQEAKGKDTPEAPRQWRVTELAFSAPRRLAQPLDVSNPGTPYLLPAMPRSASRSELPEESPADFQ